MMHVKMMFNFPFFVFLVFENWEHSYQILSGWSKIWIVDLPGQLMYQWVSQQSVWCVFGMHGVHKFGNNYFLKCFLFKNILK